MNQIFYILLIIIIINNINSYKIYENKKYLNYTKIKNFIFNQTNYEYSIEYNPNNLLSTYPNVYNISINETDRNKYRNLLNITNNIKNLTISKNNLKNISFSNINKNIMKAFLGPKKVFIMVDISNKNMKSMNKLNLMKLTIKKYLNLLNNNDEINIVSFSNSYYYLFDNFKNYYDNKEEINEYIDNLEIDMDSIWSDLGTVLKYVYQHYQNDELEHSYRNNIILLFSDTQNEIKLYDPIHIVKNNRMMNPPMIFTYIYNLKYELYSTELKQISCLTNGYYQQIHNENYINNITDIFLNYFTTSIQYTNNLIYYDNEHLYIIHPIYKQNNYFNTSILHNIEYIKYSNHQLFDLLNINKNDLIDYERNNIIYKEINKKIAYIFRSKILNEKCQSYEEFERKGYMKSEFEYRIIFITISSLYIIFTSYYFAMNVSYNDTKYIHMYYIIFIIFIILLSLDVIGIWPKFSASCEWNTSNRIILSNSIENTECCTIINCRCYNSWAESCYYKTQNLIEGECDNGYECCQWYCYDCLCSTDSNGHRSCSTCCDCAWDVWHERCESYCSICSSGIVTYQYWNKETKSYFIGSHTKRCRQDDKKCALLYITSFGPINSKTKIWYNPKNPSEYVTTLHLNWWQYIIVIFHSLILIFLTIYLYQNRIIKGYNQISNKPTEYDPINNYKTTYWSIN